MDIPVIDFEKLMENDSKALAELAFAVKDIGFLVIGNTPISEDDVRDIIKTYRSFFKRSEVEKAPYDMASTGSNRGWGRSGGEQVNSEANPDYKEVFDVGAELPEHHPMRAVTYYAPNLWPDDAFRERVTAYYAKAFDVSIALLSAIAHAANLPDSFFNDKFDPPMALLRGNYYPERPQAASEKDFGIAPHTDYGCLTLLAADGVPGLEVEMKDGSWVALTAQPGQFVINFGEMLERWSGGEVRATLHRVVGGGQERISVPFFFNPAFDTNVAPIGSGALLKAGDYLTKRYNETYLHRKAAM